MKTPVPPGMPPAPDAKTVDVTDHERNEGGGEDFCWTQEAPPDKVLKIRWQRLVTEEGTCPRCGTTEREITRATLYLTRNLDPQGIDVVLLREELSQGEFEKDPSQSNRIWINDRPLEEWLGAETGQSPCCDVCGPVECRTVEVAGEVHETIPATLIVKAALAAAEKLTGGDKDKSCC